MTTTIPEQITVTLNKDIALMLADFLYAHGYDFRRLYDHRHPAHRDPILNHVPSMESRRALIELIDLFTGKERDTEKHDPSTTLHRRRMPGKTD